MNQETLLVIPSYEDSGRLFPFLDDLLAKLPPHFKILICDDGSGKPEQKRIADRISELQANTTPDQAELLPPLLNPVNLGKGATVYAGWQHVSSPDLLAFTDADGAISADEIIRAEQYYRSRNQADKILFGSRIRMLGRTIKRTVRRHYIGRIFAAIVAIRTGIHVYDSQCGFKIVPRNAYDAIAENLQCQRFAFDVELMLLLINAGFEIEEFPIDWHDSPGGKIKLISDSWQMFWDLNEIVKRAKKN